MEDVATNAVKELRQIVHEVLEDAVRISSNKWVVNTLHGWMATIWTMDPTIYPTVTFNYGETISPRLTLNLANITARFELANKDLKVFIDAPGFTASRPENLSEPDSIIRMARWLDDAMRFALRDISFPA